MELLNQLIISCDLEFLDENILKDLREKIDSIAFKLSKLREAALK